MLLSEQQKTCFLCTPAADLLYANTADAIALCGLGPLIPGYSVVATKAHTASVADAISDAPSFLSFAERIRESLATKYGNCLVTEHGRIPVCFDPSGTSDPHCYHAHFLLFPGVPDVVQAARPYFAVVERAPSLRLALEQTAEAKDYFLISPSATEAYVMTRPGRIIRQFARVLVADAIGDSRRANWRKFPERESCANTAKILRELLTGGTAA